VGMYISLIPADVRTPISDSRCALPGSHNARCLAVLAVDWAGFAEEPEVRLLGWLHNWLAIGQHCGEITAFPPAIPRCGVLSRDSS